MSCECIKKQGRWWGLLAIVAVLGLFAAHWQSGAVGQEDEPAVSQKPIQKANELSKAFRNAAHVAMPSVVTVRSKTRAKAVKRMVPDKENPHRGENPFKGTPFEDFFNNAPDGFGDFGGRMGQMPRREGMGSGVIIDKSGVILTNNHVVEGADEVIIHLADGREFKAEDIKTDEQTDLAVVRIKGAGSLPAAKMGDSDQLEIGDWVIAVGNPFELEQTVSAGIISGKGRELGNIRRAKFLQTDAAINPGNSGGPLLNLEGEVIGINTAIATNNGSFQGIGFAIPINLAKWVTDQLVKKGNVERAYLGVQIAEVDHQLAQKFGVKRGEGVLVGDVVANSPAAEAGFHEGDVITSFDGHKVHNPRELQEFVERVPVGSKQKVDVQRDGKAVTLTVVAKALPKDGDESKSTPEPKDNEPAETSSYQSNKLGLSVEEMKPSQAKELGYKDHTGVLISKVDPDGIAAENGLRPGMLISKVGKTAVSNAEQFEAALKNESLKDGILLLVRTKGGNRFIVLQQTE